MKIGNILSLSVGQTKNAAFNLIKALIADPKLPRILCLYGDFGSGKTTFVKGIAEGLEIPTKRVKSPTFVLMNIYKGRRGVKLCHFDCYRAQAGEELTADLEEVFENSKVFVVIEWADRVKEILPKKRLDIFFNHSHRKPRIIEEGKRKITVKLIRR